MRTFLALCGSVGMTRRIAEAMEQKAAELAPLSWKLAWVPPANLHVTLKYFGSIPPESIDAIALALKQRLADLPAPVLRFKGAGVFPAAASTESSGTPRVLWVGVEGGKALSTLQEMIEKDMEAIGFVREARAYHPHLTVARVIEPPTADQIGAWKVDADFGEEKIPEVVIYESPGSTGKSHRAGAEYRVLARVPFTK